MLAPIHQRRWHPPTHSIQPNQSWSFADCRLMGRAIVPRKKAMAMMIRFCGWLRSGCCSVACRTNQGNVRVYSSLIEPNHLKGQGDLGAGIRNSTTAAAALQLLWVPWFLVSSISTSRESFSLPRIYNRFIFIFSPFFKIRGCYVSYLRHGVLLAVAVQSATIHWSFTLLR